MNSLKVRCTVFVSVLFFMLLSFDAVAQQENQSQTPKLYMQQGFWSYMFYAGSDRISEREFRKRLQLNPEAYQMYKSGKALDITGIIIGSAGAFTVGYDLGAKIAGDGGNNVVLGVGGAAMIGGMIMSFKGVKKRLKAVRLYNQQNAGFIDLSLQGTGAALSFNF